MGKYDYFVKLMNDYNKLETEVIEVDQNQEDN
jgi:uncharacterized protein YdcH (DUF465 family)